MVALTVVALWQIWEAEDQEVQVKMIMVNQGENSMKTLILTWNVEIIPEKVYEAAAGGCYYTFKNCNDCEKTVHKN